MQPDRDHVGQSEGLERLRDAMSSLLKVLLLGHRARGIRQLMVVKPDHSFSLEQDYNFKMCVDYYGLQLRGVDLSFSSSVLG